MAYLGGYAFGGQLVPRFGSLWLWSMAALTVGGVVLAALPSNPTPTQPGRSSASNLACSPDRLSFLLVWLLGGLALYYIAVLDRGAFNVRYSSFVTPALYALLGVALAAWQRIWRPLTWIGLLLFFLGASAGVRADLLDEAYFREDAAGLTSWLRANTREGDVIFVDQRYPFEFYYERFSDDVDVTPSGVELAPMRYLFVDINTIDDRLNDWAAEADRVFWVQWFESDTDPRRSVNFLLDLAGQRVDKKSFRGYSVAWWELTPPNQFQLARNLSPLNLTFASAVEAIEQTLPVDAIRPGERVPVVVRWRRVPGGAADRPLKARVGMYNGEGKLVAQNDQRLLNDRHLLPAEWGPDDQPLNVYMLETSSDLEPGEYELRLLVYDAETLEPLGFLDVAGNPAGVEAPLGIVKIVAK
ncbi:MAG: hypothetical protein HC802_04475 [Caldilineaceae bacterium]|nr:hypothetical protein [Caldilineaceae bacterium]